MSAFCVILYSVTYETPASGSVDALAVPKATRARAKSSPGPPRLDIQTDLPPPPRSRTPSPIPSPRLTQMPSFSLVGALEFRQVVTSLQHQAAGSSLNMFESPITPYAGGRYGRRPRSRTTSGELDPWDAALGVPLNDRSPPRLLVTPAFSDDPEDVSQLDGDGSQRIPSISHTPASPTTSDGDEESQYTLPTRRQRTLHVLGRTGHILLPSLHHFKSKTFLGKIASIFAAPAVLALTLTLPVMVTPYEYSHGHEEKLQGSEGRLIDFEEEGIERALIAEEEVQEDMHEMKFNRWLVATQCTLGPLFCVGVLFGALVHKAVMYHGIDGLAAGTERIGWLMIATAVAGLTVAIMVVVFADGGAHPTTQMARCSMGFLIAIVWIMAIADEVVQVLQVGSLLTG